MKLEIKGNQNYCAYVVKIENKIDLEGCDNIQGSVIFANHIIISKDTKIGDIGLYFPVECQLSDEFVKNNNLYRDVILNKDSNAKPGFFEINRRVKAMKFRGHKSDGFFAPITVMEYLKVDSSEFKVGDIFDNVDGNEICKKYFITTKGEQTHNSKQCGFFERLKKKFFKKKKLIDPIENQFRFHVDTTLLDRNINLINPDSIVSCSHKLHGTSSILSYILCKKDISLFEKFLKLFKVDINNTQYKYVVASRKLIRNHYARKNNVSEYILSMDELQPYLKKGMTLYYEIVGYKPTGKFISKNYDYDYGCDVGYHKNYIYRITTTNVDGDVIEWSAKQVQDWCKSVGLLAVPELYYGYAKDLFPELGICDVNLWRKEFLNKLAEKWLEKKSIYCKNDVWEEGIVLRLGNSNLDVFKFKSFNFKLQETKNLDKGEIDIEENVDDSDG